MVKNISSGEEASLWEGAFLVGRELPSGREHSTERELPSGRQNFSGEGASYNGREHS